MHRPSRSDVWQPVASPIGSVVLVISTCVGIALAGVVGAITAIALVVALGALAVRVSRRAHMYVEGERVAREVAKETRRKRRASIDEAWKLGVVAEGVAKYESRVSRITLAA